MLVTQIDLYPKRSRRNGWIVVVMSLFSTFSCTRQHKLPVIDTLGSSLDQTEVRFVPDIRQFAGIVVVATVVENTVVAEAVAAVRDPELKLELHLVRCKLETVLRGDLKSSAFSFYYYVDTGERGYYFYKRQFTATEGKRFVFFLAKENGVLRAVADAGPYSIAVYSGSHPGYSPDPNLGLAVADILLTPGDGYDPNEFGRELSYLPLLDDWGSRLHNIRLFRKLASNPEPIRSAACEILSRWYNGQYDCLYSIINDSTETPERREKARSLLVRSEANDGLLADTLRDPVRALEFPVIGQLDSRSQLFDELQSLLMSPNSDVRKGACAALLRFYPGQSTNGMCRSGEGGGAQ